MNKNNHINSLIYLLIYYFIEIFKALNHNSKNNKKLISPKNLQALELCLLVHKKRKIRTLKYRGQVISILTH